MLGRPGWAVLLVWVLGCQPRKEEAPRAPPSVAAPAPVTVTKAEVSVSFSLQEGAEGTARFVLKDPRTGAPVRGARLLAWMDARPEGQAAPDDAACRARIKTYLGGLLAARADVDLNSFLLLTLNHDHTLSVIDPQLSFQRTKLRNLVSLGGAAGDWALRPDGGALYVTQPTHGSVSVVDTRRFVVQRNVRVGRAPGRLALAPDGRTLWVDNEGEGTVSVLDTTTQAVLGTLEVGEGPKQFAFGEGGRTAWLSSARGEELVAVDVASREGLGRVTVGPGTRALAYSEVARALYVVREQANEVLVVDGSRREVVHRIPVAPGPGALRFEPSGRWAFVLYPRGDRVDILDTASNRVAHSLTGFSAPDQVTFTSTFAYVRNTGDARVSLIELASLEKSSTPSVVQITMGQKKPTLARELGRSPAIAVLPEGNSVLVAGTADRALYLYSEGMMAPRGTHLNYGREPRAVLVLDRSLREVEPGVYATQVRPRKNGPHDVHVLLDSPRTPVCLTWTVSGVPEDAASAGTAPLVLEPGFEPSRLLTAGQRTSLRFRLKPAAHVKDQRPLGAEELQVMVFRPPSGRWLERPVPRRVEDGVFEIDVSPPEPGQYVLLVGAESRGVTLGTLRDFKLGVQAAPTLRHVSEVQP